MLNIHKQKGSALLEGLISILIFSFGLLGTAAFQLAMTRQTNNVQQRLETTNLVSSATGSIQTNVNNIGCYVPSSGYTCPNAELGTDWFNKAHSLPGATNTAGAITSARVDYDAATRVVTIYVPWSIAKEKDLAGNRVVHSIESHIATLSGSTL